MIANITLGQQLSKWFLVKPRINILWIWTSMLRFDFLTGSFRKSPLSSILYEPLSEGDYFKIKESKFLMFFSKDFYLLFALFFLCSFYGQFFLFLSDVWADYWLILLQREQYTSFAFPVSILNCGMVSSTRSIFSSMNCSFLFPPGRTSIVDEKQLFLLSWTIFSSQ